MQTHPFLFDDGESAPGSEPGASASRSSAEGADAAGRGLGIALDELFVAAQRIGPAGTKATGCTSDWRRIAPGDVFVAVLGDCHDGHDFARRAVARGAVAVIGERHMPVFHVPQYIVHDSRVALGELCHALAGRPSDRLRVVGVAGTHGKSTTLAILEALFTTAGIETGVLSSWKHYDGMAHGAGIGPLPPPETVATRLARMEDAGISLALVELSSRGLSSGRYAGLRLDSVCLTQVTSGNLDHHHTAHNHRNATRRAFDLLAAEGAAAFNADDPVSCEWLAEFAGPSLVYSCSDAGLDSGATLTAQVVALNACETVFLMTVDDHTAAVRTQLVGEHLIADCLAAAAVALTYGIDLQTIAKGIESVTRLPGQMERVDCGQGFPLFLDAACSADGLRAALRTARRLAKGRVICVVGDDGPSSSVEALAVCSVVRRMANVAVITDRRLRRDRHWIEENAPACTVLQARDRGDAIARAIEAAQPNDVVVVTGTTGRNAFAFGQGPRSKSDVELVRQACEVVEAPPLRLAG